ncbi:uncharacterized protein LOC123316056 [Coccinella septempunctata]|uniref:uncharacterized protein LOC123316056 n=1 Tax=Coccinella septempunctata TaxID=41139 RepID=UPI001D088700|nr:uncharacterized protein LOC123316056 [Coccinella septempunctata]
MNNFKKDKLVGRAHSSLCVSSGEFSNLPVNLPSPVISTITLTPGKIRNIDQDMEALRASRQDNPFIQQVIASRESLLIDNLEEESDDANLMSKELSIDVDVDPLTLPEMHEHMIRSPPPNIWPTSPNFRVFQFPDEEQTLRIEVDVKEKFKPDVKTKQYNIEDSPLLRSNIKSQNFHADKFSLLTTSSLRPSEDSIRLMNED